MEQVRAFIPLTARHQAFLKQMFYESLFVPPGEPPYPRTIVDEPGLRKYHADWGRTTDHGWLAQVGDENVGAVWARFFKKEDEAYGFVSEAIPEIGIAIQATWRGQGIGSQLVTKMIETGEQAGWPGLSLSVDARNRARSLYGRFGFTQVDVTEHSVRMLRTF